MLKSKCHIFELAAGVDWRHKILAKMPTWYQPLNTANRTRLEKAFLQLAGERVASAETIRVKGRKILIEKVAGDIAYANFSSLCDVPLAARDYLAVAGRFAGLVLADIPQFSILNESLARRFMWLIDALYDRNRFLVASSAVDIGSLYKGDQWQFEFDRTTSRLNEMVARRQVDNA